MMSAFGDRTKKKLPSYGKPGPSARLHSSTPSGARAPESSQNAPQHPVKDIYDYDFVDEAPPPVKPMSRPRPLSTTQPTSRSPSSGTLSASPIRTSNTPKSSVTFERSSSTRGNGEATRGLKRKPSLLGPAPIHRADSSGIPTAANRTGNAGQAKRHQRESPSPDRGVIASSPPLYKQSKPIGKTATSNTTPRQRPAKTPPRDATGFKASIGIRSPSASPRKPTSVFTPTAVANTTKPRQVQSSHQVAFRTVDIQPLASDDATPRRPSQKHAPTMPAAQRPAQKKRRRLIDTLAAQMEDESSSDDGGKPKEEVAAEDGDSDSDADTILSRYRNIRSTPVSEDRAAFIELESIATASPSKASLAPSTPGTISRRAPTRRPGVKFTYNLERTMLAEEPVVLGGPQGSDLSILESLLPGPENKASSFDFDDDIDDGPSQGAIQSIHELRQAGANSRYADELVDIMDRVGRPSTGKPSSARRSALLEMVQRLQEKAFLRHFRDQGADIQLFHDVGKEADVFAGYSISCIMITLLASGSASQRLLRDFQQQQIKNIFERLLKIDTDIIALARDRKNNVSNHMRQQLGNLKETMKKLPVWKPAPAAPSQLSPRTITLKALHMFAEQLQAVSGRANGLDEDDGALSTALTSELFGIVSSTLASPYDGDESDSSPSLLLSGVSSDAESVELHLALTLLELHSVAAMQSDISAEWTRDYLPIIASALKESLNGHQQESTGLSSLALLVLKLAMNTANNNPDAARLYVEKGLLRRLADLSAVGLDALIRSAKTGEAFTSDSLNELLLMLGVMINFSENDTAAGETLAQGGGLALFDRLGTMFLNGRTIAAEADSEEKSQLNVPFAYLSILLGYLCLHEPIYQAFRRLSPSGTLRPLLESIRQFIVLHEKIGTEDNSEHGAEATARLRALAHELEMRA